MLANDQTALEQSCTSDITDLSYAFSYETWFNGDIGSWDTSR